MWASASRASSKALRVYIDATEHVYVDEVAVKPWMLESRVRDNIAGKSDPTVLVVADRGVTAEALIDVVDRCRMAGATNVGVITEKEEG